MTRKSKREIEHELDRLEEYAGAVGGRSSPELEQLYGETVYQFILQVGRDVLRVTRDPEIADTPVPEQDRATLEAITDAYDVDGDRDDAAVAALGEIRTDDPTIWPSDARDAYLAALFHVARLLEPEDREAFTDAFAQGDEDRATGILVERAYDHLADLGGHGREVPA